LALGFVKKNEPIWRFYSHFETRTKVGWGGNISPTYRRMRHTTITCSSMKGEYAVTIIASI